MTKIAVVSDTLPPARSGQGIALYRLLGNLPAESYCLVSQRGYGAALPAGRSATERVATGFLPAHYHHCPQLRQVKRGATWMARLRLFQAMNFELGTRTFPDYVSAIEAVGRLERCDALVGCSGNLWDLPAACEAARRLGIRFYAYYFDWWRYQFYWHKEIAFAERYERKALCAAQGVFVPNETLQSELEKRYGVRPIIVRNPCDSADRVVAGAPITWGAAAGRAGDVGEGAAGRAGRDGRRVEVLYTGALYGAQSDAVRTLLSALDRITTYDVRLVIHTTISRAVLRLKGIRGKVEVRGHLPDLEIRARQRSADLLFLPLSLASHYNQEVIRTAAPGKMSDYLASGRPVLVHAPENSFVAGYFRDHECGLVYTERDPAGLAEAIVGFIEDPERMTRCVGNALRLAETEFDSRVVAERFSRAIA